MEVPFKIFTKVDSKVDENRDWEQVLKKIGEYLCESGAVKDGFTDALVKRESEFPTGLQLPFDINIALAHVDPEWIIDTGMVVYFMLKPVRFRKMDDRNSVIPCQLIVIPLIKNPSDYMKFLSKQIKYVTTNEFVKLFKEHRFDKIVNDIGSLATTLFKKTVLRITWWNNDASKNDGLIKIR
jgi:galactitol PTS system EIIA component